MSGDHHTDATTARRVRRLETLLEEKGLITGERLDEAIDAFLAESSPANGARVVARAWTDDAYRARLLADGTAAVQELGHMEGSYQRLRVVENTESVHNVIVCTLCSCYPLRLLGPSPSWYKSEAYRSRVVREPRAVLREFGLTLPDSVDIVVWDSSAENRYFVLPRRPQHTDGLTEEELAALVTRDAMVGVAEVLS